MNPSTNQAPENSSSLQPNAGQPQIAGGNLQTSGGVPAGGDKSVNSLLNQGQLPNKPLRVDVANASAESSTARTQTAVPTQTQNTAWWPAFILFLVLFSIIIAAYYRFRKNSPDPIAAIAPAAELTASTPSTAVKPVKKSKKTKKKKPKKPHHR